MKNDLEWRDIEGYEGLYQIHRSGQVRSIGGLVPCKNSSKKRRKSERFVTHRLSNTGYPIVALYKYNKGKQFFVHRLLAKAFIPNPEEYPIVNHINSDPKDFRLENLEWCDQSHNMKHAFKLGRVHPPPFVKRVIDTCSGVLYATLMEAAKAVGYSYDHCSRMLNGRALNTTCLEFYS